MPPDIKDSWDANDVSTQASILAYDQVREHEEAKEFETLLKFIAGVPRL